MASSPKMALNKGLQKPANQGLDDLGDQVSNEEGRVRMKEGRVMVSNDILINKIYLFNRKIQ